MRVVDTCTGNDKLRHLIRQRVLSTPFLGRMAEIMAEITAEIMAEIMADLITPIFAA